MTAARSAKSGTSGPAEAAADSSLLLKLLFTNQPLSIQVHPDDAYAHSIGLPNGKTEAWYVLSAAPEAKVALGLKQQLTRSNCVRPSTTARSRILSCGGQCHAGDVIFVPAGTIHAIGAGLVIAEIQQRSDATFRLFDYGRQRELHVENAIAVADAGPADRPGTTEPAHRRTDASRFQSALRVRTDRSAAKFRLVSGAERETWLLVLSGGARTGSFDVATGDAVFAQSDRVDIHAGATGMVGLVAYTGGGPVPHLLQRVRQPGASDAGRPPGDAGASLRHSSKDDDSTNGRLELTQ